jgi:Arc/MetJ-type ribon-helix-helix transcriptional regulator
MKSKLSITIDKEKVVQIDKVIKKGLFRNKSHVLEYALIQFLEKEGEKNVN